MREPRLCLSCETPLSQEERRRGRKVHEACEWVYHAAQVRQWQHTHVEEIKARRKKRQKRREPRLCVHCQEPLPEDVQTSRKVHEDCQSAYRSTQMRNWEHAHTEQIQAQKQKTRQKKLSGPRFCVQCQKPLPEDAHGRRKVHETCYVAYRQNTSEQKRNLGKKRGVQEQEEK